MILIAEAGGSTTHWRVIHSDQSIDQFSTRGCNLMHHESADYLSSISEDIAPYLSASEVHFYVAGYFPGSKKGKELHASLTSTFSVASIFIYDDMLAAARSLCGQSHGWVGILGTGANVAYYDGKRIEQQVAPLGFLIGDEGSGADLGKRFIKLFFREKLSSTIKESFLQQFDLNTEDFLATIYGHNDPKQYLASFTTFLAAHYKDPAIYRMIYEAFNEHMDVFLANKADDLPIYYTGSVAYFFSDILRRVAADRKLSVGQLTQEPIAGLALYHLS